MKVSISFSEAVSQRLIQSSKNSDLAADLCQELQIAAVSMSSDGTDISLSNLEVTNRPGVGLKKGPPSNDPIKRLAIQFDLVNQRGRSAQDFIAWSARVEQKTKEAYIQSVVGQYLFKSADKRNLDRVLTVSILS